MKIIFGIIIGLLLGVSIVALRATHFCHQRGFDDWNTKGCYNDNSYIYEK